MLDYEDRFRAEVVEEFADQYLAGATPIPCVRCNQSVKFRDLLETARELGADCLATGHYIQRREGREGAELHRAADTARDQSYFLFATTREQLDFLRFPLGHLRSKAETRALAARFGLAVADKPDSQDICFVPQGGYAAVIEKLRPGAAEPGEIVDLAGHVLGRHPGIIHYTVGQRRGLGLGGGGGGGDPLYVVRLEPETRRVVVGPRRALATLTVRLAEINWLGDGAFGLAPAGRPRGARQGPIHAAPRAGPHQAHGARCRGRAPLARGRRRPRPGLRLLRPRRLPRARRRLDPRLSRPAGRPDGRHARGWHARDGAARHHPDARSREPPHDFDHPDRDRPRADRR